jgi:gamma-glutamyltranspeptidase
VSLACEKRPAVASRGMVVTNHPLGSAAGAEMLAAGGNAVDAAVAALFALTVVEPMMVGIFGAGMTHLRLADGRHLVIDNYTVAPAAARPDMYDPHPGHPASVAPGKRVTSSMAPTLVLRDGRPVWALGLPGGVRIFTSVLQALVNLIDHRMSLQEAVEAPRVWTQGQELEMEQGIPEAIRAAVAARGHRVVAVPAVAGGMNAVAFEPDRMLTGAACWRADGTPIGISGGLARAGIRFRPDAGGRRT